MTPKIGRYQHANDYCPFRGDHFGNPCGCGWTPEKEAKEFSLDLAWYVKQYQESTGDKLGYPKWGDFLRWLAGEK
jgi:hypothetical protein